MEYHSAIKKNKVMSFPTTWMNLEIIALSKVSQRENDKYHRISLTYGIPKNNRHEFIYKRERVTDIENTLTVTKREARKDTF